MQRLMKLAISFLLLSFTVFGYALPRTNPVPGGIIQLELPYTEAQAPEVRFNDKKVVVILKDNIWYALIGIPLDTKPDMLSAEIITPIHKTITFKVYPKKYPEQRLKIKNQRLIEPNKEDQERIKKEREIINTVYQTWSPADPFSEQFNAPIKGPITSVFGLQRFFNDIPANRHMGLDIAAPKNREIKAIHSGVVALNQDLFYTGNTIIIDHGQGVYSLYAHCDKTLVEVGRHVSSGQIIGFVGQTGRATGPHLHLGMIMNQVKVDPLLFISKGKIVPKQVKKTSTKDTSKRK